MTEVLKFVGENPIFTFFALWLVLGAARFIFNRTMRTLNVGLRGWPPAHLDADGDWKQTEEE